MAGRQAIAIDVGRRRVRAVLGEPLRRDVRIRRVMVEDLPPDIAADDPPAVGQWLGAELRRRGFPRAKVLLAIGRQHVVVKRLVLPTLEPDELADMTRLALQRDLPFESSLAVIDFVPLGRSGTSTTVLAVAAPRQVIEFARAMSKAAGLRLGRIGLRTMGSAALVDSLSPNGSASEADARHAGATPDADLVPSTAFHAARKPSDGNELKAQAPHSTSTPAPAPSHQQSGLAIDVTTEGVEFCISGDGAIRFSRAAEVAYPQDDLAVADAVVTEARRTWMSYRAAEGAAGGTAISQAVIMGERRVSEYASEPVSQMLNLPVHVLQSHPRVHAMDLPMDRVWPLAGMLLEPMLGKPVIDFARPRQAPDVAARTRQRWMVAAGAALVVTFALWTWARSNLTGLQRQATVLEQQAASLVPAYDRFRRDNLRLQHLRRWESLGADWLAHASYLASLAPSSDRLVFDSLIGTVELAEARFDRTTKKWSSERSLTIVIDGEARDRQTADAFRESLNKTQVYTVSTTGADAKGGKRLPYGFTYRLRTILGEPEARAGDGKSGEPGRGPDSRSTADGEPKRPPAASASDRPPATTHPQSSAGVEVDAFAGGAP